MILAAVTVNNLLKSPTESNELFLLQLVISPHHLVDLIHNFRVKITLLVHGNTKFIPEFVN